MTEKEDVLGELEKMSRERFQHLCINLLEKIGFTLTSIKSFGGDIEAEAEIERKGRVEDYVVHVSRSEGDPQREVENLKKVVGPGVKGFYLTTTQVEQFSKPSYIEVVEGDQFYELLKEHDLLPQISLNQDDRALASAKELDKNIRWGDEFLNQGKPEKAIEYFDKAISQKPESIKARLRKAEALQSKGEMEEAKEAIKETAEIAKDNSRVWTKLGNILYEMDKIDDAIETFETALQYNEDYLDAWRGLGIIFYEKGEYDEALLSFERILEVEPKNEVAWNNKGLCHMKKGELKEALDAIDSALSINPEFEDALVNKTLIYEKQERYSKALQVIDRLLNVNPENADYYYIKAAFLDRVKAYEEAIDVLDKTLEIAPHHKGAQELREQLVEIAESEKKEEIKQIEEGPEKLGGEIIEEEEEKIREEIVEELLIEEEEVKREKIEEERKKEIKHVKTLKEEDLFLENKALIYWKLGEYEKSLSCLKGIQNDRVLNLMGLNKYYLDDLDEAEEVFDNNQDYVFSKLNLESIYYEQKRYKEALDILEKIENDKIKNSVYWEKRGEDLRRSGKKEEAVLSYLKAEELTNGKVSHFIMAEARCNAGNYGIKKGIKTLESVEEENKTHEILHLMGVLNYLDEEYENALKIFEQISQYKKGIYHNSLGCTQYRLENIKEAISSFDRALELEPENPVFMNNLGVCYLDKKEYKNAYQNFSKAIRIEGEDAVSWYNKAKTGKILG
ncbi:MAG: tetratricopeptide repeat protein, partial [Thermoplasmatota archaeon]